LSDYLDGDLDTAAREKVEGHVRGCDQCARFGGRFAAVVTALRQRLAPLPPMDDGVAVRLAERLARGHEKPETGRSRQRRWGAAVGRQGASGVVAKSPYA